MLTIVKNVKSGFFTKTRETASPNHKKNFTEYYLFTEKVTETLTETLTVIIDSLYEHERIPVLDFWDCGIYTEITVRTGLQSVTVHSVPSDTLCGTLPVNSNNKASENVNRFTANVSNNCT